jgi:hypothetical protein
MNISQTFKQQVSVALELCAHVGLRIIPCSPDSPEGTLQYWIESENFTKGYERLTAPTRVWTEDGPTDKTMPGVAVVPVHRTIDGLFNACRYIDKYVAMHMVENKYGVAILGSEDRELAHEHGLAEGEILLVGDVRLIHFSYVDGSGGPTLSELVATMTDEQLAKLAEQAFVYRSDPKLQNAQDLVRLATLSIPVQMVDTLQSRISVLIDEIFMQATRRFMTIEANTADHG